MRLFSTRGGNSLFTRITFGCYILGTEISGGLDNRVVLINDEKQRVRFHEPFEQKWEKFEQHENYTLSSAGAYSLRRRVPNAIRPHSQNCYNNSRPITLEIFEPYRPMCHPKV